MYTRKKVLNDVLNVRDGIVAFVTECTLSDKNSSDKIVEISAWCRKFCPTKNFVRQKFYPMFQYKSQAKIGQICRNFSLVSKILSDEILSDKVPSSR